MASPFSFDNDVFSSFAFYGTASVVKMMMMSILTSKQRMKNKAWVNPEDFEVRGYEVKPTTSDLDVERVRRNHQNDIENIIPFAIIGLLYVATGPCETAAKWHFRVFAAARLAHTIAYQSGRSRPRGLCFAVGNVATLSMAVQVLMHAAKSW
ncbi:PREDICTED: microsomal glutathione S-transferase 1-like [Priapulus caudatus]|uniref:Microsomal glutathione S-transferase 1 n=1 Tax=Priapulus caudatus TaxID=37621 RepID=A0ABM1EG23_PRICU|nr:PREDICTED: microsomal glutathione S-transferase 1-like [Priapulus caudatus]